MSNSNYITLEYNRLRVAFGGKCIICGYNIFIQVLEFHHLDPSIKTDNISEILITKNKKLLKKELQNCVLVCRNCHALIHYGLIDLNTYIVNGKPINIDTALKGMVKSLEKYVTN